VHAALPRFVEGRLVLLADDRAEALLAAEVVGAVHATDGSRPPD
jgi:hypothetical protein